MDAGTIIIAPTTMKITGSLMGFPASIFLFKRTIPVIKSVTPPINNTAIESSRKTAGRNMTMHSN